MLPRRTTVVALLYLRTTEGREFSDPQFWDARVIPTFATHYLDAYAAWQRGDQRQVDPAWQIAFRADPGKLNCTQFIYLGINAQVNNDLAFMAEEMGPATPIRTTSTSTTCSPSAPGRSCTRRSSASCVPGCSVRSCRPTPTPTSSPGGSSPGTTPSGSWPPHPQSPGGDRQEIRQHARDKAREILGW